MATPLCAYFGSCGGCTTQHIEYEKQLENKRLTIAKALKIDDVIIQTFSDEPYNYRNRMDFIFHPNGVGFRERGSFHKIVDVEKCVISDPVINALLVEVRDFFRGVDTFDLKRKSGLMRYALIRATKLGDSAISFVLNDDAKEKESMVEKIRVFAEQSHAKNVLISFLEAARDDSTSDQFMAVKGEEYLEEELCGKRFRFLTQGFFQNNTAMAQKMQEYVRSLLQQYPTKETYSVLLDLYGGVGTFGIINADLFKNVTIIESVAPAIQYANHNIIHNQVKNAKAMVLDAKSLMRVKLDKPLYVITDPPRTGMHPKTIEQLNFLGPEVMIYISCNLEQLARELPKFKAYEVKSVALFDLFPQTNHCETVVELVRKKS
ncbi:23S rRNA (uracil(1939)-C(5))-methyltransferase RlmD [Candidatus Woesearchaeota archaeon]|nr:23S rRNA (uracil(1939)-C(5))-methyltransferase RlmD [Candidatus Woesearchaeota archaeon]